MRMYSIWGASIIIMGGTQIIYMCVENTVITEVTEKCLVFKLVSEWVHFQDLL